MSARDQDATMTNEIASQIADLRQQVEQLARQGSHLAAQAARDAAHAATDEMDTIHRQVREQPVATLVIAGMGALVGYALARIIR